jgi:ADP-heptose:LPS heptosyltransferase
MLFDASKKDRPKKIALVRLDNLGDHVLGSGLLHALGSQYRRAEIIALVPAKLLGLYRHCPYAKAAAAASLRAEFLHTFDWVIFPRYQHDHYGAWQYAEKIAKANARLVAFSFLVPSLRQRIEFVPAEPDRHVTYYALAMAEYLRSSYDAAPRLWSSAADFEALRAEWGLEDRRYVVVGLGASFPFKCPPPEVYRRIMLRLDQYGLRVLVVGLDSEADFAQDLALWRPRVTSLAGKLDLPLLAALLSHAELYIGPDAGPKHMAAAGGTPVIELSWVPEDYPRTSSGDLTAGWCWHPFGVPYRTIAPSSKVFWPRFRTDAFYREPIAGLNLSDIDDALAQVYA